MITVKCKNIDWDTDGERIKLPKNVTLTFDDSKVAEIEDPSSTFLADTLSDQYGWCINGLNYEITKSKT